MTSKIHNLKLEESGEFLEHLKKMWSRYPKPIVEPVVNHSRALELKRLRGIENE